MYTIDHLTSRPWWNYLDEDIKELLKQSILLVQTVEEWNKGFKKNLFFHDYSFVVFPASKAYEGFLKKLFLDLGFITEDDYFGKRFRIGKSLNPSLDKIRREKYGVYDKVVAFCKGNDLADAMWETWTECRNQLFHWFPNEKKAILFDEAKQKLDKIFATIEKSLVECNIKG